MKALTEVNKKCVDAVVDGKACTHWGILKRLCWPSQFPHLKFCQHSPDKRIRYLTKKKTCTCYLLWQPWQSGCGVCHCVWINQWMVLYMGDNPAVLHLDWIQVKLGMLRFHCSWTISHLNLHTGFYNHADCSEANIRGKSWYWCTRVKSCTWVWSQDHLWKTSSWNWTHFYSVLSRSQKKRTLDFNSRPVTLLWIRSVEYKRWSGFELLKVCITFLIENKKHKIPLCNAFWLFYQYISHGTHCTHTLFFWVDVDTPIFSQTACVVIPTSEGIHVNFHKMLVSGPGRDFVVSDNQRAQSNQQQKKEIYVKNPHTSN